MNAKKGLIEGPKLEVFNRHKSRLTSYDYDAIAEDGRQMRRVYPLERVGPYTKLIPLADCEILIDYLEAALEPALYDQARTLAWTVIGYYPKLELMVPDIYVFEITRVFAEAPADLGKKAADALRSHPYNLKVADVKEAVDRLVNKRRAALNQARRHLAEHQRRKAETAKPRPENLGS